MTEPIDRRDPVDHTQTVHYREPVHQPVTTLSYPETDEVKNLVQWGPIIAGVATALATMVVLTILGIAIGASALEPRESGESVGTFAGLWGAASAIVSFFLGGFVAANSASVPGKGSALLNGFMVGAAVLVLVLYLTVTGIGNLFGTVGNNLGDVANLVQDEAGEQNITAEEAETEAQDVTDDITSSADEAFDAVSSGAWGTLGGVLLGLGAATLGGLLGTNSHADLGQRRAE